MRKNILLGALAIGAVTCVYLAAEPLYLRHWLHTRIAKLTSDDRSKFSAAFGDLAYDPDPRISALLLDEIQKAPPKDLHYQLVRLIYSRAGVHYAPEDTRLPGIEVLRNLVKSKYAGTTDAQRKP